MKKSLLTSNAMIIFSFILLVVVTLSVTLFAVEDRKADVRSRASSSISLDWQTITVSEYNFSFAYPKWMNIVFDQENGKTVNWGLVNSEGKSLIDISATSLSKKDIQNIYPQFTFELVRKADLPFWKTEILNSEKTVFRKLYIAERPNKENIRVVADVLNFSPDHDDEIKIIDDVVSSIKEL